MEAGLTVNPDKCCWAGREIVFLGHRIGNGKMAIPSHRAEVIRSYRKPTTKRGLRAFLSVVSFYRRYVQMLAEETAVLSPSTSKAAPNRVVWTGEMDTAFSAICKSVCNITHHFFS